jgi:hypothetical protein
MPLLVDNKHSPRFRDCDGRRSWPVRGVYLFIDPQERRMLDSDVNRIVRVGTHAVSDGSLASLWQRLKTHKGDLKNNGNHRSSIFRLHVGTALMERESLECPTWAEAAPTNAHLMALEAILERKVSDYIGSLLVAVLPILDHPSKRSDRAYVEQNLIAILAGKHGPIEPASENWLGYSCRHPAVRRSALWNVDYTVNNFDRKFLQNLEVFVQSAIGKRTPPSNSIAPRNWYEASQAGFSQEVFDF